VSSHQAVVRVVDDDESIRRSLSGLLRSVGLSVITYGSAQDFLASDRPGPRLEPLCHLWK